MFTPDQYQLIDFGDGRRLERFGELRLDRPCPAVEDVVRADPEAWDDVDARFERSDGEEGRWSCRRELPECWSITHGPITLELRRTSVGHLGVFPEQAANWDWIAERLRGVGFSLHGSWVPRASCPCTGETPVAPGTGETPVAPGTGEMHPALAKCQWHPALARRQWHPALAKCQWHPALARRQWHPMMQALPRAVRSHDGRRRCSTCSPTPAGARWRRPRAGPRWSTSTPPETRSTGHAATRNFPAWPRCPSAGLPRMR